MSEKNDNGKMLGGLFSLFAVPPLQVPPLQKVVSEAHEEQIFVGYEGGVMVSSQPNTNGFKRVDVDFKQ